MSDDELSMDRLRHHAKHLDIDLFQFAVTTIDVLRAQITERDARIDALVSMLGEPIDALLTEQRATIERLQAELATQRASIMDELMLPPDDQVTFLVQHIQRLEADNQRLQSEIAEIRQLEGQAALDTQMTESALIDLSRGDRNGDWIDEQGCCKLCDGEIPYGHINDCHLYKMEREVVRLQSEIAELRERLRMTTHCPICGQRGGHQGGLECPGMKGVGIRLPDTKGGDR